MGILGAMSGGGAAAQDIGAAGFKSALDEERAKRVAEHTGAISEAAAKKELGRAKELAKYKAGLKTTEQGADWKFNDKTGLFWNAKTGETRSELPAGVLERLGKGSDLSSMKDVVITKTGQPMTEGRLQGEYARQWILKDEMGMERQREGAPDYETWRNSVVSKPYERTSGFGAGTEGQVSLEEATRMATKEASKREPWGPNVLRPGATEEAYGKEGREKWIENRAKELVRESGGEVPGEKLPEGIPAGSKKVGTSGGKPVYQAPNGKRYIVE